MARFNVVKGSSTRADLPVAFKVRTLELAKSMTQKSAIAQAAQEFGLALKDSYTKYAGSHTWAFGKSLAKLAEKDAVLAAELVSKEIMVDSGEEVAPTDITQ